jgi:hypothetical protein
VLLLSSQYRRGFTFVFSVCVWLFSIAFLFGHALRIRDILHDFALNISDQLPSHRLSRRVTPMVYRFAASVRTSSAFRLLGLLGLYIYQGCLHGHLAGLPGCLHLLGFVRRCICQTYLGYSICADFLGCVIGTAPVARHDCKTHVPTR